MPFSEQTISRWATWDNLLKKKTGVLTTRDFLCTHWYVYARFWCPLEVFRSRLSQPLKKGLLKSTKGAANSAACDQSYPRHVQLETYQAILVGKKTVDMMSIHEENRFPGNKRSGIILLNCSILNGVNVWNHMLFDYFLNVALPRMETTVWWTWRPLSIVDNVLPDHHTPPDGRETPIMLYKPLNCDVPGAAESVSKGQKSQSAQPHNPIPSNVTNLGNLTNSLHILGISKNSHKDLIQAIHRLRLVYKNSKRLFFQTK